MSWPQWPTAGTTQQVVGSSGINANPTATATTNPAGISYTPEQWAQMQHQNWQQWAQWQQQFQQWQQQYGAQYVKSLNDLTTQNQSQQLNLPNTAVPPPLPVDCKPPLPPDDPPISSSTNNPALPGYLSSRTNSFGSSQAPPNYPPPLLCQAIEKPWPKPQNFAEKKWTPQNNNSNSFNPNINFSKPPPNIEVMDANSKTNYSNKRSYSQPPNYGLLKKTKFQQQTEKDSWIDQRNETESTTTVQSLSPKTANIETISEAEKKFDKQFAEWEAQFQKWKEQNANHPDKIQYLEYEKKWDKWRCQLLERREQMKRKRLGLLSGNDRTNETQNNIEQIQTKNADDKTESIKTTPQIKIHSVVNLPKYQHLNISEITTSSTSSSENFAQTSSLNNAVDGEQTNLTGENNSITFLTSTTSTESIPGLDLVHQNSEKDENVEKPATIDIPNLALISKRLDSILGDEKILNMLNLVSRNQKIPTNTAVSRNENENCLNNSYEERNSINFNDSSNLQCANSSDNFTDKFDDNLSNQHHFQQSTNDDFNSFGTNVQQNFPNDNNTNFYDPNRRRDFENQQGSFEGNGEIVNYPSNSPNVMSGFQNTFQNFRNNNCIPVNDKNFVQNTINQKQLDDSNRGMELNNQFSKGVGNFQNENNKISRNLQQGNNNNGFNSQVITNEYDRLPPLETLNEFGGIQEEINSVHNNMDVDNLNPSEMKNTEVEEEPMWKPEITIDYDHKTIKQNDFEVIFEAKHSFDYRHKPLNRIPFPQRPHWLKESLKNYPEFDFNITRQFEQLRRYPSVEPMRPYDSYKIFPSDRGLPLENRKRYLQNSFDDDVVDRKSSFDDFSERRTSERRYYDNGVYYRNRSSDKKRYHDNNKADSNDSQMDKKTREKNFNNKSQFGNDYKKNNNARSSSSSSSSTNECNSNPFSKNSEQNSSNNVTLIEDVINMPGRLNRPGKIVIILRGPPGSGKTTLAKLIKDKEVENGDSAPRILSLDDYFMVEQDKDIIEDGRKMKIKEMIYEYEESMETAYRQSFIKSFKKTVTDGYFSFIIVDNVNDKVKYFGEMWSFAKQNGFQVYVCQLELDVQVCTKRNVHGRTEQEIEKCIEGWEPTPPHHPILDATSLIQSGSINEVEMEEIDSPPSTNNDEEQQEESCLLRSKWDSFDLSNDNLAKLDGTRKPLRPSTTMEDYLQLNEWVEKPTTKPGQKRVRWADLEERKQQEKMRAIGFVVGQTDWERLMDPTMGSSALTQTKYIERVKN